VSVKEMVCRILGILVTGSVLLSPVACTINRHNRIADAINHGADPTGAKCAIEADAGATAQCIAYQARREQR
jgi:hypothetical protein